MFIGTSVNQVSVSKLLDSTGGFHVTSGSIQDRYLHLIDYTYFIISGKKHEILVHTSSHHKLDG